jgi:hypothetical protein
VDIERRIVNLARVNEEQSRIANGTIGVDSNTARFGPRLWYLLAQRRSDSALLPVSGVEAGKDEQFLALSALTRGQPSFCHNEINRVFRRYKISTIRGEKRA